ncbi:MAG: Hcp family type VI secretion system effector [Streptosporangiaceae bacterium]
MAIDMFLVIPQNPANPPVTGETSADPSVATAFPNATVIPVTSFELEVENATVLGSAGAGAGAGRAQFSPLTVTKLVDKTSPSLFSACASGSHFAAVQLYLRQSAGPSQSTFLAYEFQTVFITKIDWSGSAGDQVPAETLAMEYGALVIAYKPTTSAGTPGPVTRGGWNRVANTSDVPSTLAMT